jgi:hypothetical protein
MYSFGLPRRAATEETLTITPPWPPRRVSMRRTASRAARKAPSMLTSISRRRSAACVSASGAGLWMTPALLTKTSRRPKAWSIASKRASTSASSPRSARIASARRPAVSTASVTARASASRDR